MSRLVAVGLFSLVLLFDSLRELRKALVFSPVFCFPPGAALPPVLGRGTSIYSILLTSI